MWRYAFDTTYAKDKTACWSRNSEEFYEFSLCFADFQSHHRDQVAYCFDDGVSCQDWCLLRWIHHLARRSAEGVKVWYSWSSHADYHARCGLYAQCFARFHPLHQLHILNLIYSLLLFHRLRHHLVPISYLQNRRWPFNGYFHQDWGYLAHLFTS